MQFWIVILIVFASVAVTAIATAIIVRRKDRNKVAYMLDAFEDDEMNFRFQENGKFNTTLNRMRWILERNRQRDEQQSWIKLIRVLTHEIMNTVSPIASLSEALSCSFDHPDEAQLDVKAGLKTISSSSKDLIRFVESYRALAGVARPVKKAIMLSELMDKVINLTSEQCSDANAKCTYTALSDDIILYADESQLSQIMVNLIKNALQAEASRIDIEASINAEEQVRIVVINNGKAISRESQEQIFVPFFTTKANGSGIGLSISRQIMNLHNGSIDLLESTPEKTVFELVFR